MQLISLHKGPGSEQIRQARFPVLDFGERLDEAAGPFMDTAAIIANLDLVVSSDTSIPIWPEPWAPGLSRAAFLRRMALAARPRRFSLVSHVRLFRQATLGDWDNVFERITAAVAARQTARNP